MIDDVCNNQLVVFLSIQSVFSLFVACIFRFEGVMAFIPDCKQQGARTGTSGNLMVVAPHIKMVLVLNSRGQFSSPLRDNYLRRPKQTLKRSSGGGASRVSGSGRSTQVVSNLKRYPHFPQAPAVPVRHKPVVSL